jgi:hypothetical protein
MTRDDFIRQQDIAYLDRKHKKGNWRLHQNLAISLRTWAFNLPYDVFSFQDAIEDNEIHVPFTIGVATPLWPSVRMKLTLPKLGVWSPPRLPNL